MGFLSQFTVSAVGLGSKAILNCYCSSVTVNGLPNLIRALESDERNQGRGIVTMSNHISTLDDPVAWDIMFTNPIFSTFFRLGQVVETFRGKGIFQPAIDAAIEKLNRGEWIHLFGEGKVNQESSNPQSPTAAQLLRFKWGIGRIIMEAQRPPVIIPMWLTGFDKLMPEGRPFPYKYFPKPGAALSITFGDPVPTKKIQDALGSLVHEGRLPEASRSANSALAEPSRPQAEERSGAVAGQGWLREPLSHAVEVLLRDTGVKGLDPDLAREIARVRSAVTAVIQEEVEALGRRVVLEVGRQ